ncbi:ABC transporter permease [Boudabousia liubingyangii]|uniref:carbohydrate ABC transporter permease n=1 Tax=Boudabousia liubingyangii TaxID=1921764 RepID=UPI00093EC542|nr:carbohydrate ABC transporter permease [Boudabousia liubingyangii]OKL47641.1 ABC transporter permease [Boudabousia liubingyangii]
MSTNTANPIKDFLKKRKLQREARIVNSRQIRGPRLVLRYVLLILVSIFMLGPLMLPLLVAFKAPGEPIFGEGATIIPQTWSLAAFKELFSTTNILSGITNSLIICALAVVSHIVLASVGGYILSRRGWTGRNIAYLIVMSAMIFPFEAIMSSLFAIVNDLNLYDSLIGVWLPGMLGPFHLLLMRAAFLGIPDEIEDAAFIDGAGEFRRFWSIFLPQVKGAMTIVGLTSFIYAWSDFLWPLLVLQSRENKTLTLVLAELSSSIQGVSYQEVIAGAVVAMTPVVILFFFTQKYFFRGIEDGGLKF